MASLDDLRQALLDAYAHDPKIGSPSIHVTFLEDTVALTGEVSSLQAKEEAEHLARQIVPGLAIDNSLVITGNRPADDAQLAACADRALREAGLPAGVTVLKGVARLHGDLANLNQRRQARQVVSRIPGIRAVREEEPSRIGDSQEDIALTNDVEELLATRMVFPRADEIHVWTHDRTITMDGWVKTAEEAAQAQLLAQQVAGVKSVQNRLVVTDGSTGGDEALNQEIRHAFGRKGDAVSPVDALSVVVQQVAYLWGDVDTPEQSLEAEALAKDVPGITRVINYLRVVTRRSRPSSGTTSD